MKKTVTLLSIAVLLTMLLTTGCAIHGKKIREASEGFLNALVSGDPQSASEYASEPVMLDAGVDFLSREKLEESLYKELGSDAGEIKKEDLSEEAQKAFSDFIDVLVERSFLAYTISDISEKKGVGTVRAEIEVGYDPRGERLFDADMTASEEIETYQNENREELLRIYEEQGAEAMRRKIYSDVVEIMAASMKETVENAAPQKRQIVLTVEKQDEKWIVTGIEDDKTSAEGK